ncbi:MAG: MarR family EPS-associated transcriptional regulator [Syntrophales bacterium]
MTLSNKHDVESEEILGVLREITRTPEMTQRELSNRLGISLGKINFLMKALIHKGLVKAHNFKNSSNKNAYLYYLTPHGIEEKARITYLFLIRTMKEYERLEEQIRQLRKEVAEVVTLSGSETSGSQKL